MIKLITDRTVEQMFIKEKTPLGDTALEVRNLSRNHICSDINFTVRAGEVVGFCGLMGAGRSEILRAIFGVDKRTSGEILINGKKVTINCPSDAIACGMGMVTEDRLRQGAIYTMSVMQNATIAVFHKLCNRIGYNSPKKRFNYDPSHFVWQMIDYIKPIYQFRSRIFHVHCKDIKLFPEKLDQVGVMAYPLQFMSPKLPGLGDVDWGRYISALTDIGYDGPVCIEVEDRAFEGSRERVLDSLRLSKKYMENFVI